MWSHVGDGEHVSGSARRRKERRLRAWLGHEGMTVAMALAECQHHSAQRQETARAGVWVRGALHGEVPEAPTSQESGTQHFFLDDDSVPELGGSRPDRLVDVRPQERVPRRIVEQIVDIVPVVQLLHAPVPQPVDSVVEVLKILDKSLPDVEQVIEVPKILQHVALQRSSLRSWRNSWWKCRRRPLLSFLCRRWSTSWWKCRRSCLSLLVFSLVPMGTCGGSSRGLRGPTGGEWAPLTPSGLSHRGTPPGQGGIQILALGDRGRPCDHAVRVPAVQVVRVLCRDTVHRQSAGHSSCATERDATEQFLNKVVDAVVHDSCLWSRQCSCVHQQGRRHPCSRAENRRCLRFSHRQSSMTIWSSEWLFDAFCVIFRAPPVVPELSASFPSPRR